MIFQFLVEIFLKINNYLMQVIYSLIAIVVMQMSLYGLNPRECCISSAHCVELSQFVPEPLRSSTPLAAFLWQVRPSQDTTPINRFLPIKYFKNFSSINRLND